MSLETSKLDACQLTPMMQQYINLKKEWPDCILFFRLGDFYELFFEDAVTAAKELELTLTGRDCGLDERAPMCGVPHHAVDNYIHRMIQKGYKIAICDQVEDPQLAKGIVRREVTRVITPGTITDASLLDEKKNHFILSLYKLNRTYGLAACDLSTGVFEATALITGDTANHVLDEIARYAPSEILVNPAFEADGLWNALNIRQDIMMTVRPDDDYSLRTTAEKFPDISGQTPLWAQAAAAIMVYLEETQRLRPDHLRPIQAYSLDMFMNLDPSARKNLEITETIRERTRRGSLLWAIDRTVTSVGGRLLRRWIEQPLLNLSDILQRQSSIACLKEQYMVRQEVRERLQGLYDLERLAGKLALKTANARDLTALKTTLQKIPIILDSLESVKESWIMALKNVIDPLPDLTELLQRSLIEEPPVGLKEGGLIRKGFDESIDQLRDAALHGKQWILELEQSEREKTGIKSLKIGYNRVFGYYIEVTRANLSQVPDHYQRKQTLANSERYITTELKEMEDTILGAEQKLVALEYEVFCRVREQAAASIFQMQETAHALATLDVIAALAELADRENYCRPEISLSDQIDILQGRHPVVERTLSAGGFVPNDLQMDMNESRLMILTGPNMAGKSTYLRQNALIVLMAQIGSFVPAAGAKIGIVDRIFTRIGASDDLAGGQSTFMVEMSEVSQILKHATSRSLLILDEIGRGTSTYDGLSIAWSVIEYLADREILGCRTLFATHYHELTDLADKVFGVFNCHVAVREEADSVVFLHQIRSGGTDESYGIEVARLAGIPDVVVERANELLLQLRLEHGPRQKLAIRRNARPMNGQIDLFSASQALKASDAVIEELQNLDVSNMTPLDALNHLYDLQKKASRSKRSSS